MYIQRVQVDAGFLDGLDLTLAPGLNVVFGSRGTGKTSVIELIRFALGNPGNTPESTKRAAEHARSVLGDGRVTVTVQSDSGTYIVSRSATEERPQTDGQIPPAVIFSQTEIEAVGLHAAGRLRLVDGFLSPKQRSSNREDALSSQVRSITEEISIARRELMQLDEQLKELPVVTKAYEEAKQLEKASAKGSGAIAAKAKTLDELSSQAAANAVSIAFVERFEKAASTWSATLATLRRAGPRIEPWEDDERPDPLGPLRAKFESASKRVLEAAEDLRSLETTAHATAEEFAAQRIKLDEKSRSLRKEIDALKKGAGEAAKRTAALQERRAQLESLRKLRVEEQKKLSSLERARGAILDELDEVRRQRFDQRTQTARSLTNLLGPRVRVGVMRAGLYEDYARQIAEALRGSGLRYTDIAEELSTAMSPRELLEAAEADNVQSVAESTSIARERVSRILAQLREHGLGKLATCLVEDSVNLELLDGADYKNVSGLSTGQRCTVVLPIVLAHDDRIIIVDQPEDHIDNAFIADTVIKAVEARKGLPQLIFATHNANIPVLGGAARVVQMGSDGRRGFVLLAEELDHPDAVRAITDVMEGGRKAFETRAKFYARHTK